MHSGSGCPASESTMPSTPIFVIANESSAGCLPGRLRCDQTCQPSTCPADQRL